MKVLSIEQIFSRMNSSYKKLGLQILGGYSSFLIPPQGGAQFNFVADNEYLKSTSGGIANDEATFMFGVCRFLKPRRILIIGNSYGVSTLFLSLVNLDSTVVALDKFRVTGNSVTRELLKDLGEKIVLEGSTPEDLSKIIEDHLDGIVDFCLIDAVHSNEVQTAEFQILQHYMSENSVIVFHDVLSTDLMTSFAHLEDINNNFRFKLATKTSSGLGLAMRGEFDSEFENYLEYFTQSFETVYKFSASIEALRISKYFTADSNTMYKIPLHPQT